MKEVCCSSEGASFVIEDRTVGCGGHKYEMAVRVSQAMAGHHGMFRGGVDTMPKQKRVV